MIFNSTEEFLMHHGVKGQKWGIKNGPPYPIRNEEKTIDNTIKDSKATVNNIRNKTLSDSKPPTGNQNCMLCTYSYETSKRSNFELPRAVYSPRDPLFANDIYLVNNPIIKNMRDIGDKNKIIEYIKNSQIGSRYYTHVKWANGNGGHEFMLENFKDGVYLVDAQQGTFENANSEKVNDYFSSIDLDKSYMYRTDNKKLNSKLSELNNLKNIPEWKETDIEYLKHSDLYLAHHGVKGQKWGVRRSPEELGYRNRHHSKTDRGLPTHNKIELSNEIVNKYKEKLKHIKINKNTKGYIYEKNGKISAVINTEKKPNGDIWIQGLEIFDNFKGKGYSKDLLNVAVKDLEARYLSVNKKNEIAKHIYDKYGFYTFDESDSMYFMKLNDKVQHSDYLMHHGVKGQQWGVKNGPPYPLNGEYHKRRRKINNKYADDVTSIQKKRKTLDFNVDKWGTDKDHNILYITGLSGSGKSTLAWDYAKNKSDRNTDIIHLDLYFEKHNSPDEMSQQFNKLLDKRVPDWRHMSDPWNNETRKQHWDVVDRFETALNEFGQEQYRKGRRVICEGVQLTDSGLYPNKKDLKGKPIIIMKTNFLKSSISSAKRDSETMMDFISLITDVSRLKYQKKWSKEQKTLINEISHSCLKHSNIDLDYIKTSNKNVKIKDIQRR